MAVGADLLRLSGYPFELRYSEGARVRAIAAAELAADAYTYLGRLFAGCAPDIAVIVADEAAWPHAGLPYGMPFFRDDAAELRPGIIVMSAGRGDFWAGMVDDLREAAPDAFPRLVEAYPDGAGGVDLQPFFDLITIHELGHAFEVLGDVRLPTNWLSEIFVNLALHTYVATRLPTRLETLETLSAVGAGCHRLAARMAACGYTTLDQADAHYPSSAEPMSTPNYIWFQYRWQRLAAAIFEADGERALVRFWDCFQATDRVDAADATAASLVPLLTAEVSETLGVAVRDWR